MSLPLLEATASDKELESRFRFVPQPIERPDVPEGKVLSQLLGPFPQYDSIPPYAGDVAVQWEQDTLALTELPQRYDSWGVRDDWTDADRKAMLYRGWARISLDPGDYQLLVRSRGYSRSWCWQ